MKSISLKCVLIACVVMLFSCAKEKKYFEVTGLAQGTYYRVVYEGNENLKPVFDSLLAEFDTVFSVYYDQSMISRINANDSSVRINDEFRYFFQKSQYISKITDGAFDITVAPLVNAWHFGPDTTKHSIPTQVQIDSIRQFVGMNKISLRGNRMVKTDPRVTIIGNAIAQGYSSDIIAHYLDSLQVKNYLVDVGSEMRSKGKNSQGNVWTIGITRPEENIDSIPLEDRYDIAIALDNKSLATSGNYRKFYYEGKHKYAHTINPKTGHSEPSNLLSATVLANECIEADAIATACMVVGLEKSKEFFAKHPEYDALLLYALGDTIAKYKTNGIILK